MFRPSPFTQPCKLYLDWQRVNKFAVRVNTLRRLAPKSSRFAGNTFELSSKREAMLSPISSQEQPSSFGNMSVNVRLCGSIPRRDMNERMKSSDVCSEQGILPGTMQAGPSLGARGVLQEKQPLTQLFEPPSWAVAARGETRLEPVCEAFGRQQPVDLTKKSCYRVGRSPHSDVQLYHGTSSRRHAILFHHSNGSCYIVDCGSAHGTYVNGVRIASPANGGVVVPHKVRRGALIRFGGPGAPSFILKSFSFSLSEISKVQHESSHTGELVLRNTQLNALGRATWESLVADDSTVFYKNLSVTRKRSFDSLGSGVTLDGEPFEKRIRCSSPPPASVEFPLPLVSPDIPLESVYSSKRVTFSIDPPKVFYPAMVTPEELSCDEDNGLD